MDNKILILENEKEMARLYAKCLKARGYDAELAFDGVEGLEKLKDMQPDLILLDLTMPRMSGLEFYQHICGLHDRPKYPVLVLTGRADLETLFKDCQVDGFIIKPFDAGRLVKEVNVIIDKHYSHNTDGAVKRVMVVDNEPDSAQKVREVFVNAGYKVDVSANGTVGIEMIMADPPDLAVISLSLTDLAGDLVILRMQQMVKTRKTNALLYVKRNFKHDKTILEHFARKTGVKVMLEYSRPAELLDAAKEVLGGIEAEN